MGPSGLEGSRVGAAKGLYLVPVEPRAHHSPLLPKVR